MRNPVIIASLTGGLGNQLFQYAAAVALRERFSASIKIDAGWFEETRRESLRLEAFSLDAEFLNAAYFTEIEYGDWRGVRHWLKRQVGRVRVPLGGGGALEVRRVFETATPRPNLRKIKRGSYKLIGTWQQPEIFESFRSILISELTLRKPLSVRGEAWRKRMAATPSVAIHVRRGDAIANPAYSESIFHLSSSYYNSALSKMRTLAPGSKFVVFSDEPDWVRKNMPELASFDFMDDLELEPHEVLEVMRACQHFIIANSTLSWWAAWLNEGEVISPVSWFRTAGSDWNNLSVPGWVQLHPDGRVA